MRTLIIVFLFTLITAISCQEAPKVLHSDDCVFVQDDETEDGKIDENEKSIMDQCKSDALETKSAIESNLIGEWKLIGHGEGWINKISQPCASISISETDLIFNVTNAVHDSQTTHSWEIDVIDTSNETIFRLTVEPAAPIDLAVKHFCEDYMYVNNTPSDGNMYLYQKVK